MKDEYGKGEGKYDDVASDILKKSKATVVCLMVMGNPEDKEDCERVSGMSLCTNNPPAVIAFLGALERSLPKIKSDTFASIVAAITEIKNEAKGGERKGGMDGTVPPLSPPGAGD